MLTLLSKSLTYPFLCPIKLSTIVNIFKVMNVHWSTQCNAYLHCILFFDFFWMRFIPSRTFVISYILLFCTSSFSEALFKSTTYNHKNLNKQLQGIKSLQSQHTLQIDLHRQVIFIFILMVFRNVGRKCLSHNSIS